MVGSGKTKLRQFSGKATDATTSEILLDNFVLSFGIVPLDNLN